MRAVSTVNLTKAKLNPLLAEEILKLSHHLVVDCFLEQELNAGSRNYDQFKMKFGNNRSTSLNGFEEEP